MADSSNLSKAKVKRLKRREKAARIESDLKREKKLRESAERNSETWREKALEYRRFDQRSILSLRKMSIS